MCHYNPGGGTAIYFAELVSKESSTYEENSPFKVDIVALAMRAMWHMTCCTWSTSHVPWITEKGGVLSLLQLIILLI